MSTSLILSLAFFTGLAVAYKPCSKIIGKLLNKNTAKINNSIEEAVQVKEKSSQLLNTTVVDDKIDQVVEVILQQAMQDCKSIIDNGKKNLEHSMENIIEIAIKKLQARIDQVVRSLRGASVDVAAVAVQKLIKESFDHKEKDISNFSRDLRKKLH